MKKIFYIKKYLKITSKSQEISIKIEEILITLKF